MAVEFSSEKFTNPPEVRHGEMLSQLTADDAGQPWIFTEDRQKSRTSQRITAVFHGRSPDKVNDCLHHKQAGEQPNLGHNGPPN